MKPLDEIKARMNAATPGPWEVHPEYKQVWSPSTELFISCEQESAQDAEAEFIAHSRTDIPRLVKALERCLKGIENLSEFYGAEPSEVFKEIKAIERILNGEGS